MEKEGRTEKEINKAYEDFKRMGYITTFSDLLILTK